MKGKLTKAMMVAMMLVTVFGLAASLATVSSTATVAAATDKWSRMDLPTTLNYQMLPDSVVWDLTGAADGTLFALVEDTTHDTAGVVDPALTCSVIGPCGGAGWDGMRWAVYPAYSDIALFKSTDGGCTWTLCWHVPSSENGAPIAVVPQPGYTDSDSSKDTVFVAMGARYIGTAQGGGAAGYAGAVAPAAGIPGSGNIYRSENGCDSFTRVTPICPGVIAGGSITCLDVVECTVCSGGCQNPFMAIVGVTSFGTSAGGAAGFGEGVYTWNQNGVALWNDLMISNSLQAPPTPGTMQAGWGLDVLQVYGSRNYPTDGCIIAVVNDLIAGDPATEIPGVYVCFYDANDGIWGGDIDSPTNAFRPAAAPPAQRGWGAEQIGAACIDTGTDFNSVSACYVFVGFEGELAPNVAGTFSIEEVFRVRGLSTVTGPSTITNCNVYPLLASGASTPATDDVHISDIMINGECSNPQTAVYVGCEYPEGQGQIMSLYNSLVWPGPVPSFKPVSGAWPTLVTDAAGIVFASGDDCVAAAGTYAAAYTTGGVHKMYVTSRGPVFNGVGLMDDIAVTEDIPGYFNEFGGSAYDQIAAPAVSDWCLVEALAQEVSPLYDSDGLIYVTTWSEWTHDLSLWRLTSGCWERVMYEDLRLPGGIRFESKQQETTAVRWLFANTDGGNGEIWWPRVVPQFSTDQSMFLLGGRGDWTTPGPISREMFWYSPDKGNDWRPLPQMPIGAAGWGFALPAGSGLSESGWLPVDSNHLLVGDTNGWIYRTDNRGASWTEGVFTGSTLEINLIEVSPIFSFTAGTGTDQCVLVGTYDAGSFYDEVWISQDACSMKDLENVGDEIYSNPLTWGVPQFGGTAVNFDKNWATNKIVYAAGGGWLDRWELVGLGGGGNIDMNRIDYTDTNVCRTVVDLADPSASTWKHLWNADDYNSISPKPQTLTAMALGTSVYRAAIPSAIEIGADGTVYVTFSVWDSSYNNGTGGSFGTGDNPSPNAASNRGGRFTMGGVLRCLDGTLANPEFENCQEGRGPWDGLWLNAAVPGSTHLISLTYDWKEWRFKLAFWEDTLSGSGPAIGGPAAGATSVGVLVSDTSVNVPLSWNAQTNATLYEWQVSEDAAFTSPKTGTSSGTAVTVLDLKPATNYYWRVRAAEPMLGRWSTPQDFTTVIGGDTGAAQLGTPENGATITDTTPLFTWSEVAGATNYQIQIATDPGFGAADIVVDEDLGDENAYEVDKELVNGTYYWHVKSVNADAGTETDWSALGSFTLDTEAEGAGTPVWVWVLIVLGIILALVVLVLILRTRRPV